MANAYDKARAQLSGGGELALEAMDEWQRLEIGRKTYNFVRTVMRNPEYRAMIHKRAAEIRAREAAAERAAQTIGEEVSQIISGMEVAAHE